MSVKLNEKEEDLKLNNNNNNENNNNNLFALSYKNPLKIYNNNSINFDKKNLAKSSDFKTNNKNNTLISPNNSFISSIITNKEFFSVENFMNFQTKLMN